MDTIYITQEARDYMRACVMAVPTEIGGFGFAFQDDEGRYVWRESFLVPQIVSGTEVDFETVGGESVAVERAITAGYLDDPNFIWVKWHSHANFGCHWSGTDDKYNAKLHLTGVKRLIDHVSNHKGESKTRLELYDVEHYGLVIPHLTLDNLDLIEYTERDVWMAAMADIRDHVVERKNIVKAKPAKTHTVKRSDDPGDKVEAALAEKYLDQRYAAEPLTSAEAAYDAANDDEPWLPTLYNPEVLPPDACPIDDAMDLDDKALDGFESAGFAIVKHEGQRYLIEKDDLDDTLWADCEVDIAAGLVSS